MMCCRIVGGVAAGTYQAFDAGQQQQQQQQEGHAVNAARSQGVHMCKRPLVSGMT